MGMLEYMLVLPSPCLWVCQARITLGVTESQKKPGNAGDVGIYKLNMICGYLILTSPFGAGAVHMHNVGCVALTGQTRA